ncbi:MAG: thymidine phosphorylase [Eubacteriales bacterium]
MRMTDIIAHKRDGNILSEEEIRYAVYGYTDGTVPDYQMSALLMAICLRGMNAQETSALTACMVTAGTDADEETSAAAGTADLSRLGRLSADKHSTGGVGDKTTFIVAPLAACLGCITAKMSGRGLGHTGGTIDKLESIPGYRTDMSRADFLAQAEKIGVAVIGANESLAPADRKIYALRDVTATVESIPLIASSIMSKKLAAGAENIVLDVTVGSGAFMKTADEARELARTMVDIGRRCGRNVTAVLTDMDQPLGRNIGNAIELWEAIRFLQGEDAGLDDLREVSLTLAAHMAAAVHGISAEEAYRRAYEAWKSGRAYETFLAWMTAQGGDRAWIEQPEVREKARYTRIVTAERDGYLAAADAAEIGISAMMLGAGRQKKEDVIDHTAGIRLEKKVGDMVHAGDTLAHLYASDRALLEPAAERFCGAVSFADTPPVKRPYIIDVIR